MDFNFRISFEIEGGLYTLALSEYQPNTDIPVIVVEIVLELEKQPLSPNPLKVFSFIISKIEEYIRNQLNEDMLYDQMSMKEYIDPFTGEPVIKSNKKK